MSNQIKANDRVEFDADGTGKKTVIGTVLSTSDRKALVKFDDADEPENVFQKYLTIIKVAKAPVAAKPAKIAKEPKIKIAKEKKVRAPRVPKVLGIVPTVRKDGEPSHSIVAGADLSHYELHPEVRTKSGRPTLDIGDQVAEILRGKDTDDVISITAKELTRISGVTVTQTSLKEKYGKLNAGQIRMNCGNRLRAAYRADADAQE